MLKRHSTINDNKRHSRSANLRHTNINSADYNRSFRESRDKEDALWGIDDVFFSRIGAPSAKGSCLASRISVPFCSGRTIRFARPTQGVFELATYNTWLWQEARAANPGSTGITQCGIVEYNSFVSCAL
jgi:hypothetical protein